MSATWAVEGGQRALEKDGGFGEAAGSEEKEAKVGGGVEMGGIEFEGAAEGALGEAELNDGPIVPQVRGLPLGNGFGEQARSFNDVAEEKEMCGAFLLVRSGGGVGWHTDWPQKNGAGGRPGAEELHWNLQRKGLR